MLQQGLRKRPAVGEHHDGDFGVYMSHKVQKLRAQNANIGQSTSQPSLFHGVHICVDGHTKPSKEELRQLILEHGGGFEHYETSKVTHIVATHLPASKVLQLQRMKKPTPVVDPQWVIQSIAQQKLLPTRGFLYKAFVDQTQSHLSNITRDLSNSTKDGPAFVRNYFAKSRLHHIGSWRTILQQKMPDFQSKYKGPSIRREASSSNRRVILHIDMDSFFVSVAMRNHPEHIDKPVAVAHSSKAGSSEISSCNYIARRHGLRAGIFMQQAKTMCPDLVVLPYAFDDIQQVSFQLYETFFTHTPHVQAMSCDEALLEFDGKTDGFAKAQEIRQQIYDRTKCNASVGISYNILLAKMATTRAKPNGICRLSDQEAVDTFLSSLKVKDLPGVGYSTNAKLQELGIHDVTQLRSISKTELELHVGKVTAKTLHDNANGIDTRPLSTETNFMRKSVSAVINFGIRFEREEETKAFMGALAEELVLRLQSLQVQTKCITLLVKKRKQGQPHEPVKYLGCGICDSFSKAHVLASATDDAKKIAQIGIQLLEQFQFPPQELRGVGLQATKLDSTQRPQPASLKQHLQSWLQDKKVQSKALLSPSRPQVKQTEATVPPNRSTEYALNDVYLSQVDLEVYHALPMRLRQEINRHAKPPRSLMSAQRLKKPPLPKPKQSPVKEKEVKPVESILATTWTLLEQVNTSDFEAMETLAVDVTETFDTIYARILYDVEMNALDHAARTLRFVRRKCQSIAGKALNLLLSDQFNQLLHRVNSELENLGMHSISKQTVSLLEI